MSKRTERLTNFKVVLIGQRVVHRLNQRLESQDLIRHFVHGILHTGAVVVDKSVEGNIASSGPGSVKPVHVGLHIGQAAGETLPLPIGSNVGAEDPIPRLRKSGELIADEAVELRLGALEDGQAVDSGVDVDALALDDVGGHGAGFLAVAVERVRVRLAVDDKPGPPVSDNVDVRDVDVSVGLDEVGSNNGSEEFRRRDRVLLGKDVDGVLHGIGGHNDTVVGLGVAVFWSVLMIFFSLGVYLRSLNVAFQEHANGHFHHGLLLPFADHLHHADIVLAVASSGNI